MKKYLLIALALLVAACEKPVFDEDIVSIKEANVILHMTQYEQESFGTRAATNITELCSRLNVAIFDCQLRHRRPDTRCRDIPTCGHRPQW